MQVIYLSIQDTIIIDILAWLFIHLGIGYWTSQLSIDRFDPDAPVYKTFAWEKSGEIYDKLFKVRSWKKYIPCGSKLYPDTFSLQNLVSADFEYLTLWLKESCRAEFCHWMMMVPGFFFFLWNSVSGGWFMVFYAVSNNLIPIILQRFNRPRIRRLIQYVQKNSTVSMKRHTNQRYTQEREILKSCP